MYESLYCESVAHSKPNDKTNDKKRCHSNSAASESWHLIGSEEPWGRRQINPLWQYLIMGNKQSGGKSDSCCWHTMSLPDTAGLQLQPAQVIRSEQEIRKHSEQREMVRL